MAKIQPPIMSIEELRETFSYNPQSGVLIRIKAPRCDFLGPVLTKQVKIGEKSTSKSRVCFALYHGYWPTALVDHINRNKNDNSIENLREATHTENQQNKVSYNPHGYKGVTWRDRKQKPWLCKIRVNGVRINLGSFATKEEAAKVYEEACLKYHGRFAQLGVK